MKSIKEIKKELKLTDNDLANMLGYKSAMSYRNTSSKKSLEAFMEIFYHLITTRQNSREKVPDDLTP